MLCCCAALGAAAARNADRRRHSVSRRRLDFTCSGHRGMLDVPKLLYPELHMHTSRRLFLKHTLSVCAVISTPQWSSAALAQPSGNSHQHISDIIREYSEQGIHRTGSDVDNISARWMQDRMLAMGIETNLDPLEMSRVKIEDGRLTTPGFEVDGVPLYDCQYTDAAGVTGVMAELGSGVDADIGVVMVPASTVSPQHTLLDQARRNGSYRAILVVSEQSYPADGAALINAEDFRSPVGPPVLQIGHARWADIQRLMASREPVTVIARAEREQVTAFNVSARVAGSQPGLPPLVVMTPRSGWWQCASERGGGIAAFLEIARAFSLSQPRCDVLFTANTGHELGHLGLDQYLHANPDLIKDAAVWMHLGANFAAKGSVIRLQYSDYELEDLVEGVLAQHGLVPGVETPIGSRPLGEARNVFDGGGHFVSLLGSNPLFHHPGDIWPDAVDIGTTTRWVDAFTQLAQELAEA